MQSAIGQRHYAVRSFASLIEMLRQSVTLHAGQPAFHFRYAPQEDIQIHG